jgi:UDPglucose 6-dehydrogenase
MNISVIGLGKLGCPLAAWISSKGHNVYSFDANPQVMRMISDGKSPVEEPGLQELMDAHPFRLVRGIEQAVNWSDMTFVIVPTPSDPDGAFTLKYVNKAILAIGSALRNKKHWHTVVIVSTVMPGHMDEIAGALEWSSRKACGEDFGLLYNPEFIALGTVLHDMEFPDLVLIGESDKQSGDILKSFYGESFAYSALHGPPDNKVVVPHNPPIHRMSFQSAELAKLMLNCYVTMKIEFANMAGWICDYVDGADVDEVLGAIGKDKRIGSKYLKAGVGFGGPCFTRDNRALMRFVGLATGYVTPLLPQATVAQNRQDYLYLKIVIDTWLTPRSWLGILGLAYKCGTHITEESMGMELANSFGAVTYDPLAPCTHSFHDVLGLADVLVVMLPYDEFKDLSTAQATAIIDPWGIVEKWPEDCTLVAIGREREGAG